MRPRAYDSFDAGQVRDVAVGILQRSLKLVDHGPKCTVSAVLQVLFFAAARVGSLFDACLRLAGAPTDQAVRNALAKMLPKRMPALERRLNDALAATLPKGLLKKARPLAIDTHNDPYYGKPYRRARELRRGRRERGTTRFHCYATLCVLHRGRRYTVALTYVWKDDTYEQIVRRLLGRARHLKLRVRYVLLDRGFYSVGVARCLQSLRCPFLMPVVHRGRRPKATTAAALARLGGTRRFLGRQRSGFARQVMARRREKAAVKVAVVCRRPRPGRRRRPPLVFAFWGMRLPCPAAAAQRYRTRFGIESSYRQTNQARIRTCCRNPRVRLLLVGLALLLRNLWVWIHERLLGLRRGSGIQLRPHLLRLRTLLLMLQRCAEQTFGCAETASTPICPYPRPLATLNLLA